MPLELIPILALVAMFVAATLLPINMGALGFVAAFLVGTLAVGMNTDDIIGGFPSELFLTLVGVTYLFAIAQNNGTVDLHGPGRGAARPRPRRLHPVGDVRHHRRADRHRRARPGRGRDHRADRARLRRAVPDQRAADGHDGHPRRPGRRLLADQRLRRHRQQHRREGGSAEQPAGAVPRQPVLQRRHRRAAVLRSSAAGR